jgi:GcrA cell cycle regulator
MWTEQTVETLKRLASEGRSAAWIAAAIGAPSRSAVIGKANRIGIKLVGGMGPGQGVDGARAHPPRPAGPWRQPRAASVDEETRAPGDIARRAAARMRARAPLVVERRARADRWLFATAEVGEMRRIAFAEIAEAQCRWPIGDPLQDDFTYCGLQVVRGRAYCGGHCRLVYRLPGA